MPLLLSKKINDHSAYAIWNISETKFHLADRIDETPPDRLIHPNKRAEWAVTRVLVKYLCEGFNIPYRGVGNHESGKPYLIGHEAEISITHSFPMAGALINLKKPCGIDLEWPREQLLKIQDKFLHASEKSYRDNVESLCHVWLCKEVLFKIHGKKALSFKNEMSVELGKNGVVDAKILKEGNDENHSIIIEPVFNHLLAYNL